MNDSVTITNCNCGDTICSPFSLEIEYNLNGQQAGNIIVTDSSGAQIQTSPTTVLPTNGLPATITVTLTYSGATTGDTINVALTDGSLNILASDSVGNITVVMNIGNLPVQTTAPGPLSALAGAITAHKFSIPTGQALAGTNTPAQVGGNPTKVHISVESRAAGSKRKRAVLSDQTQPGAAAGTWTYPAINVIHKGRILVFTLSDSTGNVLATERTKLT